MTAANENDLKTGLLPDVSVEETAPPVKNGPAGGGTIILTGEINYDMVRKFAEDLTAPGIKTGPVVVQIMSHGGSLTAGLAIHDMIALNPTTVVTMAFGLVASAGAVVFQAGHTRMMSPHSRLIIHRVGIEMEATLNADDLAEHQKTMLKQERLVEKLLARRSGNTMADIRKWCCASRDFSPCEAVAHGFADGIVVRAIRNRALPRRENSAARK